MRQSTADQRDSAFLTGLVEIDGTFHSTTLYQLKTRSIKNDIPVRRAGEKYAIVTSDRK